jgi:SanA protein
MAKKFILVCFIMMLTIIILIVISNFYIIQSQRQNMFRDPDLLTSPSVVVVLGTSPFLRGGSPNPFFHGRINSAYQLYKTGNVIKIIVSGSQELPFYNEPGVMRQALIDKGISQDVIIKDPSGSDTFRSILGMSNFLHSSKDFVVITQEFHTYRALFIAEQLGYKAQAFGSPDILGTPGLSVALREIFARSKAIVDVMRYRLGKLFSEPFRKTFITFSSIV